MRLCAHGSFRHPPDCITTRRAWRDAPTASLVGGGGPSGRILRTPLFENSESGFSDEDANAACSVGGGSGDGPDAGPDEAPEVSGDASSELSPDVGTDPVPGDDAGCDCQSTPGNVAGNAVPMALAFGFILLLGWRRRRLQP